MDSLRSRIGGRLRTLPDRHGGPYVIAALCAVVALGVGLRVYYAVDRIHDVQDDSRKYQELARALYHEGRYASPEVEGDDAHHPGSPLFHAGVWKLTGGEHPKASRIVAALLSALMIVCVYLLGRRLVGPETRAGPLAGLLGAALIAVYPSSIDFYGSHMNEPLAMVTLTAAMLAFLWADGRGGAWPWALPAALLGLSALFRPEILLLGALLGALAAARALRTRGGRAALAAAGVFALCFVLPIAPWTVRNAIVLDRFVPISTGGGNALFIGSYLPGDGDHFKTMEMRGELIRGEAPELTRAERRAVLIRPDLELGHVLEAIAVTRYPELPPDQALARLGREQLVDAVTTQPLDYAVMLAKKTWNMWGKAAASKPRQGQVGVPGRVYHLIVVALGAAGLALAAWRRRFEALALAIPILGGTAIGALLLAPPRRAVDLLPLVCALAAYAVAEAIAGRHWVRGSISPSLTRSR